MTGSVMPSNGKFSTSPRPKRRSNVCTIARRPAPAVLIKVPSMSQSKTVGRELAVTGCNIA